MENKTKDKNVLIQIEQLLEYVRKYKQNDLSLFQEEILNMLRVVIDESFQNQINRIRSKFKIPKECYSSTKDGERDLAYEWWEKNQNAPNPSWDNTGIVTALCIKYGLNPTRYQEFINGYIYGEGIYPYYPSEDILALKEYKRRARIFVERREGNNAKAAFIQFFKNTTKSGLKKFIDENWSIIQNIQQEIPEYSTKKSFTQDYTFKINLDIYLQYYLGFKHRVIRDKIKSVYGPYIDEQNIRKVVSNMKKKILLTKDIPYSTRENIYEERVLNPVKLDIK